ncbi:MAG: hypothetical protein KGL53_13340, partial [Elusimicrobia bacterium]|nr:hypothetical protein [Elusimicrobiota bacterium]
ALLRAPSLAAGPELVEEGDFSDERARAIFRRLGAVLGEGRVKEGWTARLLDGLDEAAAASARELLCDGREVREPERLVALVVGRARKSRRLKELEPLVLARVGGAPMDEGLYEEYKRLKSDLQGMKRGV